jgi:hypothetical protein
MIIPRTPDNVEAVIGLTLGELCTSTSPRYSNALLYILGSVPDHELDANEHAKAYFMGQMLACPTVHEAVDHCQRVLMLCFHKLS